ncbi:MAG: NAD(P)/FAD-dependent oxidoreductase, partial [Terriglobales bacterium]
PGLTAFEDSPVTGISVPRGANGLVEVTTPQGTIRAGKVVFATGGTVAPFNYLNGYLSAEQPFATQASIDPAQAFRGNLFDGGTELSPEDDYNYFRMQQEAATTAGGRPKIMFGAGSRFLEDVRPARAASAISPNLELLFPGAHRLGSWSGTIFDTEDGLPIVAQHPEHPQLFAVTGAGGIGWANSSTAADELTGRIAGKSGPFLFDPARLDQIQEEEE